MSAPVPPPGPVPAPSAPGLPAFLERIAVPPPPPRRHRGWVVVAAGLVVVVVVVAALFVTGAFSPARNSGGATPVDPTYRSAQQASASAAAGSAGGPWSPLAGSGIALAAGYRFDLAPLLANLTSAGCNVTVAAGATRSIFLPATPSTAGAGGAAAWIFLYSGTSLAGVPFPLLVVAVVNTTAQVLFSASGGVCALVAVGYQSLAQAPSLIDSSGAVTVANATGGGAFLAQYHVASRGWAIYWSRLVADPVWNVTYTDCAPGSGGQPGNIFSAQINAYTSGVQSSSAVPGVCPSSAFSILPVAMAGAHLDLRGAPEASPVPATALA